ncbi:hypothetical protein HK104_006995, partial [Borealophlyctis nickersoniae]
MPSPTQDQWLYTDRDLLHLPSLTTDPPHDLISEALWRWNQCHYISASPATIQTAKILFHRFYMHEPKSRYPYHEIAATLFHISGKVNDHIAFDKVVTVFGRAAKKGGEFTQREFEVWKERVYGHEGRVVATVGFELGPVLPVAFVRGVVRGFCDLETASEIINHACRYCGDALNTFLVVLYPAEQIAQAAVYLACLSTGRKLRGADGREWWEVLGLDLDVLHCIGDTILDSKFFETYQQCVVRHLRRIKASMAHPQVTAVRNSK